METMTFVVHKRKPADGEEPMGGSVELRLDAGTEQVDEGVITLVVSDQEAFARLEEGTLAEFSLTILENDQQLAAGGEGPEAVEA